MKRFFSVILALTLVLCAIPVSAEEETPQYCSYVYIGNVQLNDGQYLANYSSTPVTKAPAGGFAYLKDGELTLYNYNYRGSGYNHVHYSYTEDGVTHSTIASGAIFFPAKGSLKVLGTNSIENIGKAPANTSTNNYYYGSNAIVFLSDLNIYGTGTLNIKGDHGITESTKRNESPTCKTVSISCAEYNSTTRISGISMGNYLEKNTLNINCKSFNLIAGVYGIIIENQYGAAEINFNGGKANIFSDNALIASDYYGETTTNSVINVNNTTLRVNSAIIGASSGLINVNSGDAHIFGRKQAVTGIAYAGSEMVHEEAVIGGQILSIVPADKYSKKYDVNEDGSVDLFDYMTVKTICILGSYEGIPTNNADITGDGSVDVFDYLSVKNRYFNPPASVDTFEEAAFDAITQHLCNHGSYSSADGTYNLWVTQYASNQPKKSFALKTDEKRSKIIIYGEADADSSGVATTVQLTLTRGDYVGKIYATYTGSINTHATGTVDITGFCTTAPAFDSFSCSASTAIKNDFQSRAADILGEATDVHESELTHKGYALLSYLGFMHLGSMHS